MVRGSRALATASQQGASQTLNLECRLATLPKPDHRLSSPRTSFCAGDILTQQCSSSQQEHARSGAMRVECGLRQPSGAGSPLSQTTSMQGEA
jgi:hypothetical protein